LVKEDQSATNRNGDLIMNKITIVVSSTLLALVVGSVAAKEEDFRNWHFQGPNIFYDFGDVEAHNNFLVRGDSDLQGTANVGDKLTVEGDTELQLNVDVGGDLTVTGFTRLEGGANIDGQLDVDDLVVNDTLTVTNGPTVLGGNLTVAGTATVGILTVTGGADIAEPFVVAGLTEVEAGMVVSIDPEHTGQLRVADQPYDHAVAGIISGANGINTGMSLSQPGTIASGSNLVALTGRVWALVDANVGGAIQPGDLLTTSATPGHAMKASHYERRQGAILGKAMSSLNEGTGHVLVLVSLQ
jgi:hypothetical protein